jgi:glutathione S-transferase
MKLYLNKASPYARLVLVVAHEKQLSARIELVWTDPWASDERLLGVTPLAKVPVLIAEDGQALVESACICDYLDGIGGGAALLPASGNARLCVMRKYGLGRGLIDVAFGAVIEKRYGSGGDSVLVERWRGAVSRTAALLEKDPTLGLTPDLGDLTVAVALSYVDFRMSDVQWRASAPRLAAWFERIAARPSLVATAPE